MKNFDQFSHVFVSALGIFCFIFLIIAIFGPTQKEPEEKFKVVDSYHGCDIIRYTDATNRWQYFMDCKK